MDIKASRLQRINVARWKKKKVLAELLDDGGASSGQSKQAPASSAGGTVRAYRIVIASQVDPRRRSRKSCRPRSVLLCSRCRRLSNSSCPAASLERQSTVSAPTRQCRAHDPSNTKQDTSSASRPRRYASIYVSLSPGSLSDGPSLCRSNVTTTSASLRMLGTPT
jgi:hypothetical protein